MRRLRVVVVGVVVLAVISLSASLLCAQEKKWKPLMDGKTLKGWHKVGHGEWTVEDGCFVGRAHKEKLYGLLFSDDQFQDFTVRFKFESHDGDSGFYIRTIFKDPDQAHGLQVQVGPPKTGTGGIYESYGRAWIDRPKEELEKKFLKTEGWNEMMIEAHGGHVVVTVNGIKTAELQNDKGRPKGHFALQMHAGCDMTIKFKEIEMLEE